MELKDANPSSEIKSVAVIGLGFVGLPLSLLLFKKGFNVTGIDTNIDKVNSIINAKSYISDVDDKEIQEAVLSGKFYVSTDYNDLKNVQVIIVCVPTPITSEGDPDLSLLEETGKSLGNAIKAGQLVILESSTYPGTTSKILLPLLEKENFNVGKDFFLAYSPERIDPGNTFHTEDIPKIISGITKECMDRIFDLYSKVYSRVVTLSSTEAAEITKLLENSYRFINITFINQFAKLCDKLNISAKEVIDAASTKPFGFQPFYPGPGIGGHCIPVDPMYLSWISQKNGYNFDLLLLAKEINDNISNYILKKINDLSSEIKNKKILIYGITYKKDVADIRESIPIKIIESLINKNYEVSYHDPYISSIKLNDHFLQSTPLTVESISKATIVVILTDHSCIPLDTIVNHAKLLYDTRNITNKYYHKDNIYYFGGKSNE